MITCFGGLRTLILITDHYVGPHALRIINFYHDTEDTSSLRSLLDLDLDSTFPTILIGDFNLHSHSWSLPDLPTSTHARDFEAWAAAQTFDLITSPGDITRRGFNRECSSTLDLTWHNLAVSMSTPLTPPTIDWAATIGSDHARIRTGWLPEQPHSEPQHIQCLRSFKMDFDLDTEKAWKTQIKATLPLLHTPNTPSTIDQYAGDIQAVVYDACEHHLEHKRMPGPNMPSWWTPDCSAAARASRDMANRAAPNEEQTML